MNMPIRITGKGTKPSLKEYIGRDADETVNSIMESRHCIKLTDCIGINGFRNITLVGLEKRFDIICETIGTVANDIINDKIAPSEVDWQVLDIFEYWERPKSGKGFY
jgi:hypothetical protein